jgi:hypothetical protein
LAPAGAGARSHLGRSALGAIETSISDVYCTEHRFLTILFLPQRSRIVGVSCLALDFPRASCTTPVADSGPNRLSAAASIASKNRSNAPLPGCAIGDFRGGANRWEQLFTRPTLLTLFDGRVAPLPHRPAPVSTAWVFTTLPAWHCGACASGRAKDYRPKMNSEERASHVMPIHMSARVGCFRTATKSLAFGMHVVTLWPQHCPVPCS